VTINGLDSSYITELYDSHGTLLDRSEGSTLSVVALPLFAPPAYIKVIKIGNGTYCSPMSDVWGGDVTRLVKDSTSPAAQAHRGFGSYNDRTNDDAKPAGSTEVTSMNGNGQYDLIWVDDAVTGKDFSVSGSKHHVSAYVGSGWYNPVHWHGFTGATTTMSLSSSDILTQYIWLEDGKIRWRSPSRSTRTVPGGGPTGAVPEHGHNRHHWNDLRPHRQGELRQPPHRHRPMGPAYGEGLGPGLHELLGGHGRHLRPVRRYRQVGPDVQVHGGHSHQRPHLGLQGQDDLGQQDRHSRYCYVLVPHPHPDELPSVVRAYPVAATFEVQDSNSKTLYLSRASPRSTTATSSPILAKAST